MGRHAVAQEHYGAPRGASGRGIVARELDEASGALAANPSASTRLSRTHRRSTHDPSGTGRLHSTPLGMEHGSIPGVAAGAPVDGLLPAHGRRPAARREARTDR